MADLTPNPNPPISGIVGNAGTAKPKSAITGAGTGKVVSSIISGGATPTAKKTTTSTPKTKADEGLPPIVSFGKSFIDFLSTAGYFTLGAYQEGIKLGGVSDAEFKKKTGFDRSNPLAVAGVIGSELKAGADNAGAWLSGKKVQTGLDIIRTKGSGYNLKPNSPEEMAAALALDVQSDPLTYVPGGIVIKPIKALVTGGLTAVKSAKVAAATGKVSERLAYKAAETGAKKEAIAGATFLKPMTTTLDQYSWKPIIKQDLRRTTGEAGKKIAKLESIIKKNLTYKVSPLPTGQSANVSQVIGSSLEAGWKATASTFLQEYAKEGIKKAVRIENRAAKKLAKTVPSAVNSLTKDGITGDIAKDAIGVLDNEILKVTPEIIKKVRPTSTGAKEAKKLVDTLEKISTGVKGLSADGRNIRQEVTGILEKEANLARFAPNVRPQYLTKIKSVIDGNANPLETILDFVRSSDVQANNIAKVLLDKRITGTDGTTLSIKQMINGNVDFNNLSTATKKKITAQFAVFTDQATAKLSDINALLDPKTVKAIEKTGVFKDGPVDSKALKAILAGLPDGTQVVEKTYGGFADVVGGLKAGDTIDFNILQKILKTIDPDATPLKQVDKALSKDSAYELMRGLIIGDGLQTVYAAQRRLELADSGELLKADGLSLAETIAAYIDTRLAKEADAIPAAEQATRDVAAAELARWIDSPNDKVQQMIKDVLYNINAGLSGGKNIGAEGQLKFINDLLGKEDVLTVTSTFGDVAIKSATAQKAALPNQINQSLEARIFGSLTGIARTRIKDQAARLDDLILRTKMLDTALLAVLGGRIVHQKFWQKDEAKHYILNNIGDFMAIFRDTGKSDLVYKALIPDVAKAGIQKTDALSTIGIGKAIRYIAEMGERNLEVSRDEIIKMLKSRGEEQTAWSATYKKQVDDFVGDIADHLVQPDVVTAFKQAHTQRALGSVEDALGSAESLTNDLYTTLLEGFRVNIAKDIDSTAARAELARSWFNKFIYASNIFKNEQGDIAEKVFQAAALVFMKNGKIPGVAEGAALVGSPTSYDAATRAIWEASMAEIRAMYKYSTTDGVASTGRELVKKPTKDQIDKAVHELTEAELAYGKHAEKLRTIDNTPEAIKEWETGYYKLQTKLNKARTVAGNFSLTTRNYVNGDWVPSASYNRELALQNLRDAGIGSIVTDKGIINLAEKMVDDVVEPIKSYKMNAAQRKIWMDNWTKQTAVKNYDHMDGLREEIATDIINNVEAYDGIGLSVLETAQRMFQEEVGKVYEDATIKVIRGATTAKAVQRGTALAEGEIRPSRLALRGEAMSATSGRWNLRPILGRADVSLMQNLNNIADVAHQINLSYKQLMKERPEVFAQAFKHAVSKTEVPADAEPVLQELTLAIRSILDPLFGDPSVTKIGASGLHPDMLAAAFRKYGLTDTAGFVNPSSMNPKQLSEYASWMPFSEIPASIVGTPEEELFKQNAKKFAESGIDPMVMVTRLAQAVQFAKTEQAFVLDFATRFSYKAQGLTFEQAMKKGWVKIEGISLGGTDLSKYLPEAEKGGLFDPEIAKEFLSLNREWNKLYNSKGVPKFVATAMNVTGFLKATQTIFRLGHHITNAFGDTTTAMIAGTRNPKHWKQGLDLAKMFMSQDVAATWGRNKLDAKFDRLFDGYESYGAAFTAKGKTGAMSPAIAINQNGKLSRVALSNEDLFKAFKERGILMGNIFHNDIQGLYDSIVSESGQLIGKKKEVRQVIAAKIKLGTQKLEQPAGAFASWYGNVPRAAHAMQVLQSRSWSSIDEALNAAQEAVNRYHPSIQSLAAGERKSARLVFTYYTWLRVAHNALIDMALNHTGAMLVPAKYQYNEARQNGLQPKSFGNPWGDETIAPEYLKYSVYGPTEIGSNGPTLYKRSILPMDVLDTWNLSYDPTKSFDKNVMATGGEIMKDLGGMLNPFIQIPIQAVDPNFIPGSVKVEDIGGKTMQDAVLQKTGFYNLLQGIGAYTPPGKAVGETTNPLTPEERQRKLTNWLTGQKQTFVETSGNLKNYNIEQTNRWKQWIERQGK